MWTEWEGGEGVCTLCIKMHFNFLPNMQQPAICNAVLCLHTAPCRVIITIALPEGERVLDGVVGRRDGVERRDGVGGSPHPLLFPITTPLTVHTGMMSSGNMKYLVVMLRGLSAIN